MKYNIDKYVSVIIPVYNTEKYLESCLDSIVNQELNNYEIIIINDGSTDNSSEIAKKYANNYSFILYFEQDNKGLAATRNLGIERASGKYIYFMDSDDLLEENSLNILYNLAEENKLDAVFFDADVFFDYTNNEKKIYNYHRQKSYGLYDNGQELFNDLINNKEFLASACLYFIRTDIIRKFELKFPIGIIHEDELFTVKLMMVIKKCMHINEQYFKRRIRKNSIVTSSNNENKIMGYSVVFNKLEKMFNETIFVNDYIKYSYEINMGGIYHTILKINNHLEKKSDKIKNQINEVKKTASYHNYFFGTRGVVMTYNYPLYSLLSKVKQTVFCRK